jgi:hypothetical protein
MWSAPVLRPNPRLELQRGGSRITPTLEGEIYYRRRKAILAEFEDAE